MIGMEQALWSFVVAQKRVVPAWGVADDCVGVRPFLDLAGTNLKCSLDERVAADRVSDLVAQGFRRCVDALKKFTRKPDADLGVFCSAHALHGSTEERHAQYNDLTSATQCDTMGIQR